MANRAAFNNSKRVVASGVYLTPEALKKRVDRSAPPIQVGTSSGQPQTFSALCKVDLTGHPKELPISGHVMPGFHHNPIRVGEFCDAYCKVLFSKIMVTIFDEKGKPFLTGWRDNNSPKLCNISLLPNEDDSPGCN